MNDKKTEEKNYTKFKKTHYFSVDNNRIAYILTSKVN